MRKSALLFVQIRRTLISLHIRAADQCLPYSNKQSINTGVAKTLTSLLRGILFEHGLTTTFPMTFLKLFRLVHCSRGLTFAHIVIKYLL